MIEAVNSVVSNAQTARNAVASSQATSGVSAQIQAQEAVNTAPRAPFISPYVAFDTNFDTAVIQIRDSATGDVLRQIPTEKSLELRQLVNARREAQSASRQRLEDAIQSAPSPQTSAPSPSQTAASQQNSTPAPTIQAQAQAVSPSNTNTSAGAAQVAVAALSAGALTGQSAAGSINVTA